MKFSKALPVIAEALTECFSSDPDLTAKWHIAAPAPVYDCVSRTLDDMEKHFHQDSFCFYTVMVDNELAGYWGTEHGSYINLIFVKPKYRKPEFMHDFWSAIQNSVSQPFFTSVYAKNEPAVKFYSKFGRISKREKYQGHDIISFEFNKESKSCQ